MAEKKFIDSNGLLYYHQGLKTKYVANVAYDSAAGKITKTVNGVASDILSLSTLKTDMALNNVGNFKAVSTIASQGLTNAEKTNARENIGAGTSSFGGSFSDLTNKPTTLAGYGITDAKIENGTITLGSDTITPLITHQDISGKADKATTLAGYGITDAKIENGTVTLGANSITPLTSHQDISGKLDKTLGVTAVAYDTTGAKFTETINGATSDIVSLSTLKTDMALNNVGNFKAVSTIANQGLTTTEKSNARANIGAGTSSFSGEFSALTNKPTTLAGYGITDAKIENGTITLGSSTISLSGVYKYKGSVATKAALDEMTQASLTTGDVYNVESNGKNYAYVEWDNTESKPVWDDLGGTFSIEAITNAEIDAILAS